MLQLQMRVYFSHDWQYSTCVHDSNPFLIISVQASVAVECPSDSTTAAGGASRLGGFNNKPMNQAKVLVGYTDPSDTRLKGRFNWTFQLDADLAVAEADFPMDTDLGVWEWWVDESSGKGVVRVYQRVSQQYSWICTYFGAGDPVCCATQLTMQCVRCWYRGQGKSGIRRPWHDD